MDTSEVAKLIREAVVEYWDEDYLSASEPIVNQFVVTIEDKSYMISVKALK